MISLTTDKLISLPEAARRLPGKVHPATLWRWSAKGRSGKKLKTLRIGRLRYTTLEALERFLEETDTHGDGPARVRMPRQSAAQKYCEDEGI